MTDGVYGGGEGVYTGADGVYASIETDPPEAFDTFEWGGPLSERYEVKHYDGEITEDVAYRGKYGVTSGMDYFLMWGHPSEVYDEGNRKPRGKHSRYPRVGDEMASVMRLTNFHSNRVWVGWALSFGQTNTYHWHRYTVNPVYRDRFRVVAWTRDGYDIVADSGKREVNWAALLDRWLVFYAKWYHPDIDGRTGVRAICFPADDFPFDDFTLEAYENGQFPDLDAISDIDTANHSRGDRSRWFDTDRQHRFGFGTTNNVAADFDDILLLNRPR